MPSVVEAAMTRTRLLVGRLPLEGCLWREHSGKELACPLCGHSKEDVIHFLATCPSLDRVRSHQIEKLTNMWTQIGIIPPQTPTEIASALLNGDRYYPDSRDGVVMLRSLNIEAHRLASSTCHKLWVERDHCLNDKIMANL